MQERIQGGVTGGVDELYREVILDHFKAPKNKGKIADANAKADGVNPLCGDQISISAVIENGRLKDVKFDGHGCAISQSAASMMTEAMKGKALDELRRIARAYKKMFGVDDASGEPAASEEELGDLISLEGVKKYPVRIKCALLSCNTILQGIDAYTKDHGASK